MTTPLDSATLISYKRVIFRQSDYVFCSYLAVLSRNPPYFYFRSAWPNFLKSGSLVWRNGYLPPNLKLMRLSVTEIWHLYLQYVTLHCDLDDWPFGLEWLSEILSIRSWVMMFTLLTAIGNTNSLGQLRMRSITWLCCRELILTTFLKSLTPICLFTLQLLWRYDED